MCTEPVDPKDPLAEFREFVRNSKRREEAILEELRRVNTEMSNIKTRLGLTDVEQGEKSGNGHTR